MIKNIFILISLIFLSLPLLAQRQGDEQGLEVPTTLQLSQDREAVEKAFNGWWKDSMKDIDQRMTWYNDAKFGCFIHWGVYSVPAGIWKGKELGGYTEHLMRQAKIPLNEYKTELVAPFNPTEFDAEEWIQHAIDAGMKYFIITAKHHDGFAMYPSNAYPYDIRQTEWKQDPMRELRNAAKKHGIKFGFYYSHAFDWEHPDAPGNDWDYDNPGGDKGLYGGRDWWMTYPEFLSQAKKYVDEKSIPQIVELMKNYEPDLLWFDTPHKLPLFENIRILEAIRQNEVKTELVVNGRLARFADYNLGDYKNSGDRASYFPPTDGYWESIPTTNESYGYSKVDTERKSVGYFIRLLASATAKGGNILMNVGPMGNGKWDTADVEIFRGVGDWLKVHGEAIYRNRKTDLPIQSWGVTTQKNDIVYLHIYDWNKDGSILVGGLTSDVKKVWIVNDSLKQSISFTKLGDKDLALTLPLSAPDTINTVIALQIAKAKPAYPIRLLDTKKENKLLTFDSELIGGGLGYGDGKENKHLARYYITGWKNNLQAMKWNLRALESVEYDVYLEYNTVTNNDSGTVIVDIDGNTFVVNYTPLTENNGVNKIYVGTIQPTNKEFVCTLKGKTYNGTQYMRPTAIKLVPR